MIRITNKWFQTIVQYNISKEEIVNEIESWNERLERVKWVRSAFERNENDYVGNDIKRQNAEKNVDKNRFRNNVRSVFDLENENRVSDDFK